MEVGGAWLADVSPPLNYCSAAHQKQSLQGLRACSGRATCCCQPGGPGLLGCCSLSWESRQGAAVPLAPGAAQGDGRLLGIQIILSKIPFQNPSLFPKAPKPAAPHRFRTGLGQKLSPSPATGHRSCHLLQVARESLSWAPCCSWKGLGACSGFPDVSFCRCRQMCYFFFCLVALQKCRETSGLCDLRLRIAHVFLSGGELVPCFWRQAAFINTN